MVLAVFDFDGTLFPKDTLPFLLSQWRKQKRSRRRLYATYLAVGGMYIRYKLKLFGALSREQMRKKALQRFTRIFCGMTWQQVDAFFEQCAALIVQQLRECVLNEFKLAQQKGCHTVLLSGGYTRLMDYVGGTLGFDAIIGTDLHHKNGFVDVTKPLDIVCGDEKAQRLRAAFADQPVDWDSSTAFADSLSDMPILKLVGHPVAVNPDAGLKAALAQTNWPVLDER